jgi:aminoglycoside/choline kinase family phosphotransferase
MRDGTLDSLIIETRQRFPHYQDGVFDIHPIEKGGSDRKYYRIRFGADASLILVKYRVDRGENARFVAIANFLSGIGINAPLIYFHDEEQGSIWLQDLGDEDLWHHRNDNWDARGELYRRTLDEALILHKTDPEVRLPPNGPPEFDASLFRWEQEYGFQNCFQLCFRIEEGRIREIANRTEFTSLAEQLAAYPRVLIHRDFQSQNILICDEQAYLIDFQGMRPGLGAYDLASLLYDPYVTLSSAEREQLVDYYLEGYGHSESRDEFIDLFLRCALQRLLQALGAYGVIGVRRQKPEFLRHIGPAIDNLREVASLLPGFSFFEDFLSELPDKPKPLPNAA